LCLVFGKSCPTCIKFVSFFFFFLIIKNNILMRLLFFCKNIFLF
jgi:hypothetical protein